MFNVLKRFRSKPVEPEVVPQTIDVGFTSIIAQDMASAGHMLIKKSIRIDGTHIGKIVKDPDSKELVTVIVSKTGVVNGLINADILIVEGRVRGTTRSTMGLYVTGQLEGIAFYGDKVEIEGEPVARFIKMNERQKALLPAAPSFDAETLLDGCDYMPNRDGAELKVLFEDIENSLQQNGDVMHKLFPKNESPISTTMNESSAKIDITSTAKVSPLRVVSPPSETTNSDNNVEDHIPTTTINDEPNMISLYH